MQIRPTFTYRAELIFKETWLCPQVKDPVVEATDIFVKLLPLKVGVPYRAFGIVPDVKFDASRAVKSTWAVTEEELILASANVPLVIFDVAKSGTSLADNDNRAEGTVPEVRLDAFRLDRSTC